MLHQSSSNKTLSQDYALNSCLDSRYSMRFSLPSLFFSENTGEIKRRAAFVRGTFHYSCIFILDYLFGRIGKETLDKNFESSTYHSLCQTCGIESWKEMDYYISDITKKKLI